MKKYCIFDFDGTLVNSMPEWAAGMIRILDEENIPYPDDIIRTITPLGYAGSAKLYREMGVRSTQEELVSRMNAYAYDAYANRIIAKEGVREFLQKLVSEGHILAVLTASPHSVVDICLKRNGIYGLFEKVWTVDDFGLVKSDPAIYIQAARRLGADLDEITFFDDNIKALATAKSAGLECAGVFDASSESDTDAIKQLSDVYIFSFKELLA